MTMFSPLISANVRSTARRSAPWKSRLTGLPVYLRSFGCPVPSIGGVGGCGDVGLIVVEPDVCDGGAAGVAPPLRPSALNTSMAARSLAVFSAIIASGAPRADDAARTDADAFDEGLSK